MNRFKNILTIVFVILISFSLVASAQRAGDEARVSPNALVSQTVGTSVITVEYGRPGVKDRTVWGELVPYNSVWRAGANEATTLEFSTAVTINQQKLPAGKYSLFILPTAEKWTVIINSVSKQWGAYKYDKTKDVLRFDVIPAEVPHVVEWLEFYFNELTPDSANLNLAWEKLSISFPIKTGK